MRDWAMHIKLKPRVHLRITMLIQHTERCQQRTATNRDFLLRDNNCRVSATYSNGRHSSLVDRLKCILWNTLSLDKVHSRI